MIRKEWLRFKVFFHRFGLGITVTLLIMISIILSLSLWYNVSNPGRVDSRQDKQDTAKTLVGNKPIQALYDTDKVILNTKDAQKLILNYRGSTNEISEKVYAWPLYEARRKVYSEKDYLKKIKQANYVMLAYPDVVTGDIVDRDFESETGLTAKTHINRILLPLDGKGAILFGDDRRHQIYEAQVAGTVKPLKVNWGNNKIDVDLFWKDNQIQVLVNSPVKLKERSFLLDTNKVSDITKKAFNQNGPAPKVTKRGSDTIYSEGSDHQLISNEKTGELTLNAYSDKQKVNTMDNRFKSGYAWMTTRTTVPENMYYFEQSNDAQKINYRLYSDGLPIFNADRSSSIEINFKSDERTQVAFSKYSIQVPLPRHNDVDVTLPNEKSALQQAQSSGIDTNKIEELRVGYDWVSDPNAEFVRLVPKWFMKVDGDWEPINNNKQDATVEAGDPS
ncbi:two-component system activity regulator YycH [Weissella viridescens]|nr:two-component system activity regulator YycH [Weissella viridescens]